MTTKDLGMKLARVAVRRFRLIALVSLGAGALVGTLSILGPREWVVPFAFVAETDRESGGSALASELGLGGASTTGPDFYIDLLKTNEALLPLMSKRYQTSEKTSTTIADLLKVGEAEPDVREARTLKALHSRIVATASRRSGVVSVTVRLPDRFVSKKVAEDLLAAINDVNTRVRQTRGRNDRVFSEERRRVIHAELSAAEDALRVFLEQNRFLASSPALQVERMRLERTISVHAATLESVELAFEAARRDEVQNTPRISIIEPPRVQAIGMARGTVRQVLITTILVGLLLVLLAYRAEQRAAGSIRALFRNEVRRLREALGTSAAQRAERASVAARER